jgi:uncharacterized protein (DUF849 family)
MTTAQNSGGTAAEQAAPVSVAAFPYPAHPRTPYAPLIINAALTGMIPTRARVPHVPLTAGEVVDDAARCFEAGARIVHLHARDAEERPEWRRSAYEEMIPEIRRRCPGVVVCVTTSGRYVSEIDRRADVLLLEGEARPDLASLTLGSLNFGTGPSINSIDTIEELGRRMADAGIRPELEIFDVGMAHLAYRLLTRGLIEPPLYANLLLGFPNSAPANARGLLALIETLPAETCWSVGALGAFQRPMTTLAAVIGGHIRTGLEDNPWADTEGVVPTTNEQLVLTASSAGAQVGRQPAATEETRDLLGLPSVAPVGRACPG